MCLAVRARHGGCGSASASGANISGWTLFILQPLLKSSFTCSIAGTHGVALGARKINLKSACHPSIIAAMSLSHDDKLVLLQHAISRYDLEATIKEKLKDVLSAKDVERGIDTLIATQRVRRIGPDVIQNNESAMGELPELPDHLKEIVEKL
jgi:hypothetical protein